MGDRLRPKPAGRVSQFLGSSVLATACAAGLAGSLSGCAASSPTIKQETQAGDLKASADNAAVLAKADKVDTKLDLAMTKIVNSRDINAENTRDIVKTEIGKATQETIKAARDLAMTTTNTGTSSRDMAIIIIAIVVSGCTMLGWMKYCDVLMARVEEERDKAGVCKTP